MPVEMAGKAIDRAPAPAARSMSLGDSVVFYKLGLELLMAGGYDELIQLVGWLVAKDKT